ncbi:MAG: hypothetical protein QXL67_00425 [Candidatus Bathyarchaeia archaeon]
MLSAVKNCSPKCKFFKCGRHALNFHGSTPWCSWADERCDLANCAYALCVKRKLLNNGVCGEAIRRRTVERKPEEELTPVLRVRGKTIKKLGDRNLF